MERNQLPSLESILRFDKDPRLEQQKLTSISYDSFYKYAKIVQTEETMYQGSVSKWFSNIVWEVVKNEPTQELRAVSWINFIRRRMVHSAFPVIDDHGHLMYSVPKLLEMRIGQCGQIARLVEDGLQTLAIRSRIIQMNNHVSAEYNIRGRWIFAEANFLKYGDEIYNSIGQLATLDEIIANPSLKFQVTPMPEIGVVATPYTIEEWRREFDSRWENAFLPIRHNDPPLTTPYVITRRIPFFKFSRSNSGWNYASFQRR